MIKIKENDVVCCLDDITKEKCYLTVDHIEDGTVSGYTFSDDGDYLFMPVSSVVSVLKRKKRTQKKLARFVRYEITAREFIGDAELADIIDVPHSHALNAEDLLCAVTNCINKPEKKWRSEWFDPMMYELSDLWHFADFKDDKAQNYRGLPSERMEVSELFFSLKYMKEPTGKALLDRTANSLKEIITRRNIPVPLRSYSDEIKLCYLNALKTDAALKSASNEETALFVQYTDELCEKDSPVAMEIKAYACYGGNAAYPCDWTTSRDLLLRLVQTENADAAWHNTLGYIFYYGRCTDGVPEYDKAFYHFSIGAAGGLYESRYKLSDMFLNSFHVQKNEQLTSHIIRELYCENIKYIIDNHIDTKFADIALRLGNLYSRGIEDGSSHKPNPDAAYRYYLQAQFAIRLRQQKRDWFGDASVAAGINGMIESILPRTSYVKPRYSVEYPTFASLLFNTYRHRMIEMKLHRLKSGRYSASLRILPKEGEKYPPKLFMTVPEAHFCGFMEKIKVILKPRCSGALPYINGKAMKDDKAVVLFDEAKYADLTLYGKPVFSFDGNLVLDLSCLRTAPKYRIASVSFDLSSRKHYDYLCDLKDVQPEDTVIVPTPTGETAVRVLNVSEKSEYEMTLPLKKYKTVLRKANAKNV